MGMLCMLDPGTHGTSALSLHGHMPLCTGLLLENAIRKDILDDVFADLPMAISSSQSSASLSQVICCMKCYSAS